jgi:hypothetical protein
MAYQPISQEALRAELIANQHMSFDYAERRYMNGGMSESAWRRYKFFWTWTDCRMGGVIGWRHDRAYRKLGSRRYWRRINRVRKWAGLKLYNLPDTELKERIQMGVR